MFVGKTVIVIRVRVRQEMPCSVTLLVFAFLSSGLFLRFEQFERLERLERLLPIQPIEPTEPIELAFIACWRR